jgi:hypothetical protein
MNRAPADAGAVAVDLRAGASPQAAGVARADTLDPDIADNLVAVG